MRVSAAVLYIETNQNMALMLACFQGWHKVHVVSLLCQRGIKMEHHTEVGEGGEGRVEGGVRW